MDFEKIIDLLGMSKDTKQSEPQIIKVPNYVNYMSEWKEFELPAGHVIIDKTTCGCGFTEYCLSNNIPTILLSPRKVLLENKEESHNYPKDEAGNPLPVLFPVYYFKNEYDTTISNYDEGGISKEKIQCLSDLSEIDIEKRQRYLSKIKTDLQDTIKYMSQVMNKVPKILCTYDSARHVFDSIGYENLGAWSIIVDEFQSIFTDSAFKGEIELEVVKYLQKTPNVCYVSATPMLGRYIGLMDYFKQLRHIKLDWGTWRTEKVYIDRRKVESITSSCSDWINRYKIGKFPLETDGSGNVIVSNELVIFLNSVSGICSLIKKCKLLPDEVNIICAHTAKNRAKLNKLGTDMKSIYYNETGMSLSSKYDYGHVPMKHEKNKMFTFCTRTSYIGADFYSKCATTIICSNINIDVLNLDIALDLPQIVGRQRCKDNLFRNKIIYLEQGVNSNCIPVDDFVDHINKKVKETRGLLNSYEITPEEDKPGLVNVYKRGMNNYKSNFVGFDGNTPVNNVLVMLSEIRNYEITRPEYQETVIVKRELDQMENIEFSKDAVTDNEEVNTIVLEFLQDGVFTRRMKLLCEVYLNSKSLYEKVAVALKSGGLGIFDIYIRGVGVDFIRANSYQENLIRNEMINKSKNDRLVERIYQEFVENESYSLKQIKIKLKAIYDAEGIIRVPKATDLDEWFETKTGKLQVSGKWEHGLKLLRKKEE